MRANRHRAGQPKFGRGQGGGRGKGLRRRARRMKKTMGSAGSSCGGGVLPYPAGRVGSRIHAGFAVGRVLPSAPPVAATMFLTTPPPLPTALPPLPAPRQRGSSASPSHFSLLRAFPGLAFVSRAAFSFLLLSLHLYSQLTRLRRLICPSVSACINATPIPCFFQHAFLSRASNGLVHE